VVGAGAGAFLAPLPPRVELAMSCHNTTTQSAHRGTQGLRRSLEPNLAAEAGSRFLGSSRLQPVHCECSPSVIQHVTIILEIKLNIMAYLSNGKGHNSTIMEKTVNSIRTIQSTQFSSFSFLRPESGWSINRTNVELFLCFLTVI
jgi:hypothetical protein